MPGVLAWIAGSQQKAPQAASLLGAAEALAAIPAVMQPALSAHHDAALAARQEAFAPGRVAWIAALDADHENGQRALRSGRRSPGAAR